MGRGGQMELQSMRLIYFFLTLYQAQLLQRVQVWMLIQIRHLTLWLIAISTIVHNRKLPFYQVTNNH